MSALASGIAGAAVLAGVHAFTPVVERLSSPRQTALASASGGAGLAYVCLYLLFELVKEGAEEIHSFVPIGPEPLETLFILILGALAAAYIAQVQLEKSRDLRDDHRGYIAFFVVYNVLVGAGLVEEARWGALSLAFYVAALGVHMVFNDLLLQHLFARLHNWRWRALLAVGPPAGAIIAASVRLPHGLLYSLIALIAGGTIITIVRRELPEVDSFRPFAFIVGLAVYSALIFATWRF